MNITATLASLILWVFYSVSFTKDFVARLSKDPTTSNAIIRFWALILGVGGALGDYFFTTQTYSRVAVYSQLKLGLAAAVAAIVTYHIGQGLFKSAFDSESLVTPSVLNAVNQANAPLQKALDDLRRTTVQTPPSYTLTTAPIALLDNTAGPNNPSTPPFTATQPNTESPTIVIP